MRTAETERKGRKYLVMNLGTFFFFFIIEVQHYWHTTNDIKHYISSGVQHSNLMFVYIVKWGTSFIERQMIGDWNLTSTWLFGEVCIVVLIMYTTLISSFQII